MRLKGTIKFCRHLGYRMLFYGRKYAPEICLSLAGMTGLGCVITACKSTTKLDGVLKHHNDLLAETKEIIKKEPERFTPKQQRRMVTSVYTNTAVELGKLYAKPAILGAATVVEVLSGYHILRQRNIALTTALAFAERKLQNYQNEQARLMEGSPVINNEDSEVMTEQKAEAKEKPVPNEMFEFFWGEGDDDFGDPRIYGPYSNVYIARQKEAYANKLLQIQGAFTMNDLLALFRKQITKQGVFAGWIYDPAKGDHQIDIGLDNPRNIRFVQGDEPKGFWVIPNCESYILDKMLAAKRDMWDFYNGGKRE